MCKRSGEKRPFQLILLKFICDWTVPLPGSLPNPPGRAEDGRNKDWLQILVLPHMPWSYSVKMGEASSQRLSASSQENRVVQFLPWLFEKPSARRQKRTLSQACPSCFSKSGSARKGVGDFRKSEVRAGSCALQPIDARTAHPQ